jgi:hypothetical protein
MPRWNGPFLNGWPPRYRVAIGIELETYCPTTPSVKSEPAAVGPAKVINPSSKAQVAEAQTHRIGVPVNEFISYRDLEKGRAPSRENLESFDSALGRRGKKCNYERECLSG